MNEDVSTWPTGLRLANLVHSDHPELIFIALLKIGNLKYIKDGLACISITTNLIVFTLYTVVGHGVPLTSVQSVSALPFF